MIINIFSIFNPYNSILNLNYFIFVVLIFIAYLFKVKKINIFIQQILKFLIKEKYSILKANQNKKIIIKIIIRLFYLIIILNLLGLIRYGYCITAHIFTPLYLALIFWVTILFINLLKNYFNFISHLTPLGTPIFLINFIVLIELVRFIIRPLTLFLRLIINIISGHILILLLSNFILTKKIYLITIILYVFILIEIIVCLIQSYVFTILLNLYYSENNYFTKIKFIL